MLSRITPGVNTNNEVISEVDAFVNTVIANATANLVTRDELKSKSQQLKFCKDRAIFSKRTGLNKSQRSYYPTPGFDKSYPSLMKVVSPVAPVR